MTTVDRILELVEESGLTAKEFAENAKIAGGSITDWKTGRSKPSVESLQKIAKYANVQLEWLTGDSEFKTKEEELEDLIKFYQEKSGLSPNIIRASLYEDLNLTDDENNLLNEISEGISEAIKNNTLNQFNTYNYLKNLNEDSKKRIINALNIVSTSQAQLSFILASKAQEEHIKSLDQTLNFMDETLKLSNNLAHLVRIPILGKIAAGQPILAQENLEGYLPVDPNMYGMSNPEDYFYLRVNDNSINLKVKNSDYALIHKQDYADNGDIIVAIVNGDDEATLKRYKRLTAQFILLEPMSTDPTIESITVDLKNTKFQIIGKAIGQFGKF